MSVVAIERIVDGALTSADSATLQITNSAGATTLAATPVTPTSAGIYSYTTSALVPGTYTAIWTFNVTGYTPDVIVRPFVVDSPIVSTTGIMLKDIEALVARRCGSYLRVKGGSSSSTTQIHSLRLKSSQNLGNFETEYALRRGLYWDGTVVPNFVADDRVRGLVTYVPGDGTVSVDQAYTQQPQTNEAVELMYLEPEFELRPAVLQGLTQCYFWDEITVSYDGLGQDLNLTAVAPWVTDKFQVKRMQYGLLGSRVPPNRVAWYEPYRSGSSVYIRSAGVMAGNLQLTVLRPHSSFVNGEISYSGPNDDLDILHVDPEYAAWAGVRQMWIDNPERVAPVTSQNMRPTRDEVASQFTMYSLRIAEQIPDFITHRWDNYTDLGVIGNLPEPVV